MGNRKEPEPVHTPGPVWDTARNDWPSLGAGWLPEGEFGRPIGEKRCPLVSFFTEEGGEEEEDLIFVACWEVTRGNQ